MHGWETRMLLKHYLERRVSKTELSRRFGVSRRTIHEWIETGQLDREVSSGGARYTPRPPMGHKLDPYKGIIDARLDEYPKLSAKRLFDEIRAAGYPGGYSRVRDYVRGVRPREAVEAAVRFETPAGRQGQVDFGTFTLPWGNRRLETAMRASRLPAVKTLAQFDFAFQPSLKREQIESLHRVGVPESRRERHPARSAGRGQHASGHQLGDRRRRVRPPRLLRHPGGPDRVAHGGLGGAGNLSRRLRVLTHPALLVVDENGYLPVSQDGAVLFFQLINARHERASTVLTSNKGFEEWGSVLGDEVMAAPSSTACSTPPTKGDILALLKGDILALLKGDILALG